MALEYGKLHAGEILKSARSEYGNGWNKLTDQQRQHYISHRVLLLILTQEGAQFAPAQSLARSVLQALPKA